MGRKSLNFLGNWIKWRRKRRKRKARRVSTRNISAANMILQTVHRRTSRLKVNIRSINATNMIPTVLTMNRQRKSIANAIQEAEVVAVIEARGVTIAEDLR